MSSRKIEPLVILTVILFLCLGISPVWAGDVGIVGADFLRVKAGPRATAMAGAYTAVSDDGFGMYWNPAGMSRLERGVFSVSHEQLFPDLDIDNEYLSLAYPFGASHTVGVGGRLLHTTDYYRSEWEDGSDFTNYSGSFSLNYAYGSRYGLSLGAGAKYIREQLADYDASSYALDLGLHYSSPRTPLRLGAVVQNLGPDIKFIEEGDPLPRTVRAGWAYDFQPFERRLTLANDLIYYQPENITYFALGAEYNLVNFLDLRAGYSTSRDYSDDGQFYTGLGVNDGQFAFDYSYSDRTNLEASHVFSMSFEFGHRPEERLIRERPEIVDPEERRRFREGLERDLKELIPERSEEIDEENAELNSRAEQHLEAGNYEQAIELWEQSLRDAPGQSGVYRQLGQAYYQIGNYEKAREYLQNARDNQ